MTSRLEPELVEKLEEIVSRRLKAELEERSKLVTTDQFQQAMERMDERFARMDERFDNFESSQNQLLYMVKDISSQMGKSLEQFGRNMVERVLLGEGFTKLVLKGDTLEDPTYSVSSATTTVEIDGISLDPPIIVEITAVLRDEDKAQRLIAKKKFVEQKYHKEFRGFLVASGCELDSASKATLVGKLHLENIELLNL